ncbi:hypothetical protein [secondary endosymbiont of Ctenarytaina eucalypti]|uniref:Uncharacterized protein n=1 Tax=secondary endosymbiont of Ctenarytaina eucalypti TaxID=1199245 RepID=J3YR89_9ENTR|nr:hypothetical protein [secondary endosymbiont of Ctenarytaina eucalypti]AFP84543.1 hypothetical protein A359_01400 [secondary endosymbiont of Ctenarytaina eucalypti]
MKNVFHHAALGLILMGLYGCGLKPPFIVQKWDNTDQKQTVTVEANAHEVVDLVIQKYRL